VENALPTDAAGTPRGRRLPAPGLIAAGVVTAALAVAYAPNLAELYRQWSNEPNYSHGFLVAPIALAILWQRREDLDPAQLRPKVLGWVALVAILIVRAYLFERNERWAEGATLIPALAALALAFGGWHLLRWAAPAIAFLVFMLPLPPGINMTLAGPLQQLATLGSTGLLQALGLPVLAQGNVIFIGDQRLEVAQACNGLSMLMSFVTLITAMVILMARDRPTWERVVLLLSMIPIALLANIIRIAATALLYHGFGAQAAMPWPIDAWYPTVEKFVHDTAGWAMMPIALVLVLLELKVLSWLIVEDEAAAAASGRPLVLPPLAYGPVGPPPKKPTPGGPESV